MWSLLDEKNIGMLVLQHHCLYYIMSSESCLCKQNLHSKVLSFQKRNHLRLMTNVYCVIERLEDVVPKHDLVLRVGVDCGFNMDDLAGAGGIEWAILVY